MVNSVFDVLMMICHMSNQLFHFEVLLVPEQIILNIRQGCALQRGEETES